MRNLQDKSYYEILVFSFSRFPFSRFLILAIAAILLIPRASAQLVEIPDPNLREAIRETLQLPAGSPITQQDMEKLEYLDNEKTEKMGITDLTGLEYATNLSSIPLNQNEITDLSPLSNLIQLEALAAWGNPISDISPLAKLTNLRYIDLGSCDIADITPLSNLTKLETLQLGWNYIIKDISPLSNLTNLQSLRLNHNRIVDISPLANLTQLKELFINGNRIGDFSPLDGLSLTILERDERPYTPCELPHLPIEIRLQNRSFPSVFGAFAKPTDTQIIGLNHLSPIEQLALHDLTWRDPYFGVAFINTPQGWKLAGFVERAQEIRDDLLALNPNMLLLVGVRIRDAWTGYYPEDFPYWLRDENGNIIKTPSGNFLLTDFTQPGLQDIIVQQAIAVAECGLFDGIFFDWFAEDGPVLVSANPDSWDEGHIGVEEEQQAKDKILQRIRAQVRDDFLIIINTGRTKIPRRAWGINGTFMETLSDTQRGLPVTNGHPYGHKGLKQIEKTLAWAEENLRSPQINCLEGWGDPGEPPDSPVNLRFMRVFTTMSLTHSDGYVLYGMDNTHQHIWYDFWDADLGRPIGPKAQQYQNIEGLFIREFTNGWAVYNRSGKEQTISLSEPTTGVSSNKQDIIHPLLDLDGEIYLKVKNPADVNGDWAINILDLVQVANAFGESSPDLNGDGVVNILDLVFVTQQFSQ